MKRVTQSGKLTIHIVTPARSGTRYGNRVTALRWARRLKELGHRVVIEQSYQGGKCDLLVALHAKRSAPSIARYRKLLPHGPLVVALTGTDLYGDIRTDASAKSSLELADRLVLLQPRGIDELAPHLHAKVVTIYQAAEPLKGVVRRSRDAFEVGVMGHLREVKDPFRTAQASRLVPAESRLHVIHMGGSLQDGYAAIARAEMAENPRYVWKGELPRPRALRILAGCRLLSLSSITEGGANVVTEAISARVPVVSSHIPGSAGLLGDDYPGYFPVGDTRALAELLWRCESDERFYHDLVRRCRRLRPLVRPARERASWRALIHGLVREPDRISPRSAKRS